MYYTDSIGHTCRIATPPQKIISLVPSQTELLFDLGLEERVAALTKYCIHPKEKVRKKPKIGGTKDFNIDKILSFKPDLVIANKEENTKEGIAALQKQVPIWTSDIFKLEEALKMIIEIGKITNTVEKSEILKKEIQTNFENLARKIPKEKPKLRVLYLIWKEPYMAAGSQNFIDDMIKRAGFENALTAPRYPILELSDIEALRPDLLFLSTEPYPFKAVHFEALHKILPYTNLATDFHLVDGELFSWYGSRLLKSPAYFAELFQKISSNRS
ncbi:ABC transporter substrate-binding protein [Hugenholtzia roseola]|uniref:ABC transporter substrate-binding protein n=1 Tax=Hugenholtzia roseola TaxID=1002 RepID=UPI0003FBF078|nr:helical backbone metal receptor [Hugenholtzia roseola]